MPLIKLSVQHGRSLAEAQSSLEALKSELQKQAGLYLTRSEVSEDRRTLYLAGSGFEARIAVDEREALTEIDLPIIGKLFAAPLIAALQGAVKKKFQALE